MYYVDWVSGGEVVAIGLTAVNMARQSKQDHGNMLPLDEESQTC